MRSRSQVKGLGWGRVFGGQHLSHDTARWGADHGALSEVPTHMTAHRLTTERTPSVHHRLPSAFSPPLPGHPWRPGLILTRAQASLWPWGRPGLSQASPGNALHCHMGLLCCSFLAALSSSRCSRLASHLPVVPDLASSLSFLSPHLERGQSVSKSPAGRRTKPALCPQSPHWPLGTCLKLWTLPPCLQGSWGLA